MRIKNGDLELNVLAKDVNNLLLQKANTGEFVIAYGWDEAQGSWQCGSYFGSDLESLEMAVKKFKYLHEEDFTLACRIENLRAMGEVLKNMNNEAAYYDTDFCSCFIDQPTDEDYLDMAQNERNYKEICEVFKVLYSRYHNSGLYTANPSILLKAHDFDKEFDLKPIENCREV